MRNQEMLSEIKFIRNVFDTISLEAGMASRLASDVWAEVLQDGDRVQGMGFGMNMLNKIDALRGHLYSIQLKAEKVAKGECDKEMRDVA
jgi:hypothetical protein